MLEISATIDVVAAVLVQADRYLICKRPLDKRHGGLWEFPGGKVNPGESFSEAVQRELQEELELSVVEVRPALFSCLDPGSRFAVHFIPVSTTCTPVLREHDELMWCDVSGLLSLPLAPSDKKFVEFLGA